MVQINRPTAQPDKPDYHVLFAATEGQPVRKGRRRNSVIDVPTRIGAERGDHVARRHKMTDGELRGLVLQKFYDLRHEDNNIQLPKVAEVAPDEPRRIANICKQLGQNGLIDWRPIESLSDVIGGMGEITARGVDVIEGTANPPIAITLYDHSVSVHESSHVQIGNSNTQNVTMHIGKLIAAVDHSNASDAEKKEAKSLLQKLAENPLVQSVWGYVFGGS